MYHQIEHCHLLSTQYYVAICSSNCHLLEQTATPFPIPIKIYQQRDSKELWKKEKAQQGKKKETANLISSCKKKSTMYVFSFLNHLIKLTLLQFAMINR